MKTIQCDILKTEFTEKGINICFEKMGEYVIRPVKKNEIEVKLYVDFINSELQKLRGEPVTIENKSGIITKHGKKYVSIEMEIEENIYKVTNMKKRIYELFFHCEYSKILQLIQ